MKIANLFKPGTHAFWGTTYTLGLALFDQYLLRRLGGPPLNAVLLADHWKLGEMWDRLDPEEHYLARQANRLCPFRGARDLRFQAAISMAGSGSHGLPLRAVVTALSAVRPWDAAESR